MSQSDHLQGNSDLVRDTSEEKEAFSEPLEDTSSLRHDFEQGGFRESVPLGAGDLPILQCFQRDAETLGGL